MRRIAVLLVSAGGIVLGVAAPAQATVFVVGTTADSVSANPSVGDCSIPPCALREAVTDANADPNAPHTIQLPAGTFILTHDALPTIVKDVTIVGPGADAVTITGANTTAGPSPAGGVFAVTSPGKLTIRGVTISGNRVTGNVLHAGGAIAADGADVVIERSVLRGNRNEVATSPGGGSGGAIDSFQAALTVTDSAIEDNVDAGTGATTAAGGVAGEQATGAVTIVRSSISRNRVDPPSGTNVTGAGALFVNVGPTLSVSDSTVSQNSVSASATTNARVGGIRTNVLSGAVTLTNVTVTDNATTNPAGNTAGNLVFLSTTSRVVRNSIVAGGAPGNCLVPATSSGGNVEDANTCGFTAPGDLVNTDPQLGALRNNGGLGLTQAPLFSSPLFGFAQSQFCSASDQRGVVRPAGDGCDSGAFEGTPPPTNTAPPSVSGTAAEGQTLTCAPGSYTGAPTTTAQWLRDGAAVATGFTYTLTADDLDKAMQCRVTATNVSGAVVVTSASVVAPKPPAVAAPAPPTPPANTARPSFSGTLRTGQKLSCAPGTFTGATSFAFAWLRSGAPIAKATAATYILTATDAGKALQCQVTATGPGGTIAAESAPAVPAKACIVPSLAGQTLSAARKRLTVANCALGKVTKRKSTRKPGVVLSSSPAKGKNLAAGTRIALAVARK